MRRVATRLDEWPRRTRRSSKRSIASRWAVVGLAFGQTITYQSSLQIALFVARCWCSGARRWGCSGVAQATHLDLVFTPLEVVSVMLTVLTVVVFGMSGRTSWFEGVPLLGLYLILGSRSFGASGRSACGRGSAPA